ncbi:hypothetical protein LPTSP4_19790 [Leptospira ryugenii]|uniref:HTH tetR-type domain-containing protein n=1 Tax=Leptospira ryugenii TaxID=1917863 RepID=A0A2P2E0P0_9LEPT|nr:hypothetical protein LPTSP4_19790 [Leptospira ryugenii]
MAISHKQNEKIIQGEETKKAILKIAKKLFGKKGYNGTSIEDILGELKMTKGALYHHFSNKREIFFEVCKIINQAETRNWETMTWKEFKQSLNHLWDLADDPDFVQIWIKDCFSVLSSDEIFSLDEDYVIKPFQKFLERMCKEKQIVSLPSFEEAHLLVGLVNQGLWLLSTTEKKERPKTRQNLNKIILSYVNFRELR